MLRSLALASIAVLLSGCAGASVSPPQSTILPQAVNHSLGTRGGSPTGFGLCSRWPSGSGILRNGDFHLSPNPGPGVVTWSKGANFTRAWAVTKGSIDLVGPGDFNPPNGVCSIDLDGISVGGIGHAPFDTVAAAAYTVGFQFSGNGSCGPNVKTMLVKAAGQSTTLTWDLSTQGSANNGNFLQETWIFTATGSRTSLTFTSLDQPPTNTCGPVVAAVSVTKN
jgi:choice-of-anchor C domain-containing protein